MKGTYNVHPGDRPLTGQRAAPSDLCGLAGRAAACTGQERRPALWLWAALAFLSWAPGHQVTHTLSRRHAESWAQMFHMHLPRPGQPAPTCLVPWLVCGLNAERAVAAVPRIPSHRAAPTVLTLSSLPTSLEAHMCELC